MSRLADSCRAEMLSYDSCVVSDALEKLGLPIGIGDLRRLATRSRVFGSIVTVTLDQFRGDVPKRHLGTQAIDLATPGDVIVVQHDARTDCAGWGGLLSTAAVRKRVSGVLVDGFVRDIDECEELAFPVFARGAIPVTARGRVMEIATNAPVQIAGVAVQPGDFVLADGSGAAFIPASRLDDVLSAVRGMIEFENGIRRCIAGGDPMTEAMDGSYERLLERSRGGQK